MDCSLPGFSVHGILQSRILEWAAIPFSRGSSRPRDQTQTSCTAGRLFTVWVTREACVLCLVTQSCLTLHDPMDCSPPGSSVHGILQSRILEWIAISLSRGYSWPRDPTQVSCIIGRFFTIWTTRKALKQGNTNSWSYLFFSNFFKRSLCSWVT